MHVFSSKKFLTVTIFISLSLVIALAIIACCGCHMLYSNESTWPENVSFVVFDEEAGKHDFERTYDFVPSARRVVLLPVVLNYQWEGKRRRIALADPFVVEPGKKSLRQMMAHLETDRQTVWRCLVLAPGYCPRGLSSNFIYAGTYQGKEVQLSQMARIADDQYGLVFSSIMSELNQATLILEEESSFDQALQKQKTLSTRELESPILHTPAELGNPLRSKERRKFYILWNHYAGTQVDVCISESGMNLLRNELSMTNSPSPSLSEELCTQE